MANVLLIEPEKCTTCRLCELVCSERGEGTFRPSRSRIRVWIDAEAADYVPMVCTQCDDAPCMEECPTEALVRDPVTNAVVVVGEKCDECAVCESACPYGVIRCADSLARKCDLCGGDPECVRFCATGAIQYAEPDRWPHSAREAYTERLRSLCEEAQA
jgi:Fe-S-cluster-containing hydrogenase component 2